MIEKELAKIEELIIRINTEVNTKVIKETVNGKIDAMRTELGVMRNDLSVHNTSHENDMARIMPVVEAFEDTKKSGLRVLWAAGFIIALGGAYEVLRNIFVH